MAGDSGCYIACHQGLIICIAWQKPQLQAIEAPVIPNLQHFGTRARQEVDRSGRNYGCLSFEIEHRTDGGFTLGAFFLV